MRAHRAVIRWSASSLALHLPITRRYIHPAVRSPTPPPWGDGQAWTLTCALDASPTVDATEVGACVALLMPGAPQDWLVAGTTLYVFEGSRLSAEVTITGETRELPALGWRLQLASDLIADGMGLELYDVDDRLQAELFRSDANRDVTLTVYRELSPEVLAWVFSDGGRLLGTFEDGTPLPAPRVWRHVVE